VAPGSAAPELSFTVPEIVPVLTSPQAIPLNTNKHTNTPQTLPHLRIRMKNHPFEELRLLDVRCTTRNGPIGIRKI
jgi:hypothetical protein